ncbi:MAG: hypothetical protein ACRD1L_04580, partial [Terriglobales bacterium]
MCGIGGPPVFTSQCGALRSYRRHSTISHSRAAGMANDQEIGVGKPPARPEARERPEERLDSWKEIAAYLRRDVTTVQRWEKREGMPVHRHVHAKIGSVYAFRSELDGWVRNRKIEPDQESRYDGSSSEVAAPTQPRQRLIFRLRWRLVVPLAAAAAVLGTGASLWLQRAGYFWRNPIVDARYQTIASFDGQAEAAAISRDGQFVAFLSDRDGQMDVWVTQAGSGQFHNLTRGSAPELVNPAVRTLGFSPDGSQVTFWARKPSDASGRRIGIWSVPTLGGEPRPYLEDVAEYDWSRDGSRLAYHTTASGDPLFVSGGSPRAGDRALHTAPIGQHCHFPLWSPDAAFIYFVEGTLPDKLNLWRMPATGGKPEPITPQPGRVGYPVLLDLRTLLYLSSDTDGSGPWLYGMDVKRRIPHRLTFGPEMYTSLASSADGRRLAATVALPQTTLWRVRLGDPAAPASAPEKIELTAGTGSAPRFGPDYLVYASSAGTTASIWKLVNGSSAELWT